MTDDPYQFKDKAAFQRQTLGDEPKMDTFTVRLNPEERLKLDEAKKILRQEKDSTAMKQLTEIGLYVLHGTSTGHILKLILANKRRNERTGLVQESDL